MYLSIDCPTSSKVNDKLAIPISVFPLKNNSNKNKCWYVQYSRTVIRFAIKEGEVNEHCQLFLIFGSCNNISLK